MRIKLLSGVRTSSQREILVLFTAAIAAALCFLLLTWTVWRSNKPVGLDRIAERLGFGARLEGPLGEHVRLAEAAEELGSRKVVGAAAVALLALALIWRDWIAGVVALVSPMLCFALIEYVAKPAINAPVPVGGRAYPSGHVAGVTAVSVSALVLIYRRWGGGATFAAAPFGLAVVMAAGLGVLGLDLHHYATDVIGGAALGAAVPLTLVAMLSLGVSWWRGARVSSASHSVPAPTDQ